MDLIIRTTKGTDPLRPEFGSKVYNYVDAPMNIAVPNIKREILDALELWEKRIKVISINHYLESPGHVVFEVVYRVVDENIVDKLIFDLQNGRTISDSLNEIILQAFFPPNPNGYRYQVQLIKNGSQVYPLPDPNGYTTINDLFNWIKGNWFFLGRWYLLADRIMCYMNADGATSATLAIEVLPIVRFEADFPLLPSPTFAEGDSIMSDEFTDEFEVAFIRHYYKVQFKVNGIDAVPAMPEIFESPGDVLAWVRANWNNYAEWLIEFILSSGEGIFSDEFSDEFDVDATGYRLVGISNVEGFVGELTITTVE